MSLPLRLFVTGTGTDVGKTVVSALLLAGRGGYYWKPVQSGVNEGTDSETLRRMTGLPDDRFLPEAYSLTEPLSPHEAAAIDGVRIEPSRLNIPDTPADAPLVVEGAGGLLVPMADGFLMADLMAALGLPVLVVASSGLGTINHTLLTLAELRRRGLEIAGVVMNGPKNTGNREAIETYGNVKVVAEVEPMDNLSPEALAVAFKKSFAS